MIGPGKYDKQLSAALIACGANQGLLIAYDGKEGPGFSAQLTMELMINVPKILRSIADEIEKDFKKADI